MASANRSPDTHSSGFLASAPDALRYEHAAADPDDAGIKLATLIGPNARVLDVGCGTGSVTEVIRDHTSATVIAIEPDPERVQHARGRGLDVHLGLLSREFLQEHGPFDYIVFSDVLEHIANPAEMVELAKSGLTPGGSILASIPNVAHWFVRTDLLRGRFEYQDCGIMDATHLRWFTRATVQEFFERLGLKITALDYTVNIGLPDYYRRAPWRWMPMPLRRRLVKLFAAWSPGLFGCQHIVRATLPD